MGQSSQMSLETEAGSGRTIRSSARWTVDRARRIRELRLPGFPPLVRRTNQLRTVIELQSQHPVLDGRAHHTVMENAEYGSRRHRIRLHADPNQRAVSGREVE